MCVRIQLHLAINEKGGVIQWMLTLGNTDDREPLKDRNFTQKLFGKIFADRGYISHPPLFFFKIDVTTITRRVSSNHRPHH